MAKESILTTLSDEKIAAQYSFMDEQAKALGSTLHAPFMTLSFMALLVIQIGRAHV